jgi:eukaryotic translation initiation factor 2C
MKIWGAVNFSARCNVNDLIRRLIQAGDMKGIVSSSVPSNIAFSLEEIMVSLNQFDLQKMETCAVVIEESHQMNREPPAKRVEAMFQRLKSSFKQEPEFLLCVLPEKNCDIYGLLFYLNTRK